MRRWLHKLVSVFRHRRLDSELDEEIHTHLDMATEEYVRGGMGPREARLAARRSFGRVDQVKERHRDVHILHSESTDVGDRRAYGPRRGS